MNKPHILVLYLEDIFEAARIAPNRKARKILHDKLKSVIKELDKLNNQYFLTMGENIGRAQWSIDAILGYGNGNGHSADQHAVWTIGALNVLKQHIKEKR